jgi:hypothetical protein
MKILKGEELFNQDGLHILDERGFAICAEQDIDCNIASEHLARVSQIVIANRLAKGLDEDGNEIKKEEPKQEEIIEEPIEQ